MEDQSDVDAAIAALKETSVSRAVGLSTTESTPRRSLCKHQRSLTGYVVSYRKDIG